MDMRLVKWTPPVQTLVRQEAAPLSAPQGGAAHDAPAGAAAPRQPVRSALSDRLVRQLRQRATPEQAAADPHAALFEARTRRAEESVTALAALG